MLWICKANLKVIKRRSRPAKSAQSLPAPATETYIIDIDDAAIPADAVRSMDYIGDKDLLYCYGKVIMDAYCNATPWKINLKDIGYFKRLELVITPLKEEPVYIKAEVNYLNSCAACLNHVWAEAVYITKIL